MSILVQLGANYTAFIQFGLFVFTITYLTLYVYGPYFKAYDKRIELTKGGEDLAHEVSRKAAEAKATFETEARNLAGKIRTIFDGEKVAGQKAAEQIVAETKLETTRAIDENRTKLATTVAHVASELSKQAPSLSKNIKNRLLGT